MHGHDLASAKAHVTKSFDRLQAATGLPNVPTGWFCGSGTHSMKLARAEVIYSSCKRADGQIHREREVPLLYCSDTYGADLPYYVQDPYAAVHGGEDKGMLMIPYSLCTNDHLCELRPGVFAYQYSLCSARGGCEQARRLV